MGEQVKSEEEQPEKEVNIHDDEGRVSDPDYAFEIAKQSDKARERRGTFGIFPASKKKIDIEEKKAEERIEYWGVEIAKENIPGDVLKKLDEKFESLPIKLFDIKYHKKLIPEGIVYWIEGYRKITGSPKAQVEYFIQVNSDGSFGEDNFSDLSGYNGQPEPE